MRTRLDWPDFQVEIIGRSVCSKQRRLIDYRVLEKVTLNKRWHLWVKLVGSDDGWVLNQSVVEILDRKYLPGVDNCQFRWLQLIQGFIVRIFILQACHSILRCIWLTGNHRKLQALMWWIFIAPPQVHLNRLVIAVLLVHAHHSLKLLQIVILVPVVVGGFEAVHFFCRTRMHSDLLFVPTSYPVRAFDNCDLHFEIGLVVQEILLSHMHMTRAALCVISHSKCNVKVNIFEIEWRFRFVMLVV